MYTLSDALINDILHIVKQNINIYISLNYVLFLCHHPLFCNLVRMCTKSLSVIKFFKFASRISTLYRSEFYYKNTLNFAITDV